MDENAAAESFLESAGPCGGLNFGGRDDAEYYLPIGMVQLRLHFREVGEQVSVCRGSLMEKNYEI